MALSMSVSAGEHNPRHNTDLDYRAGLENVDPSMSHLNVTLADEGVSHAYERLFGAAAEAYNAKQREKHPERVIGDYHAKVESAWRADLAKVAAGKKKRSNVPAPQIEYVVQVGNRDTWRDALSVEDYRAIYTEAFEAVKAKTRGAIDWYQAAIHFDEPDGTPHLHIVGIAYGTGNKRGLETQVSMKQALATLGLDRLPDLQSLMMGELERVCHTHGVERDVMDCKRRHQDVPAWQQTCRDLADMTDKLETKAEQVAEAETRLECLQGQIEELEPAAVSLGESAGTVISHLGDGSREREVGSRIEELEREVRAARSRAGELERDVERLRVGVRDAGSRFDRVRERVTHLLEQLGWVPKGLSEVATSIGRALGLRVRDAFSAKMDLARDGAAAWNAAHATRGASRDREGKQTR